MLMLRKREMSPQKTKRYLKKPSILQSISRFGNKFCGPVLRIICRLTAPKAMDGSCLIICGEGAEQARP